MTGTCYLLHFSEPFRHARHYIGWTIDLEGRIHEHRTGSGARLIQVITEAGLSFELARTWEGDRWLERRLKRSYHGPPICPLCNPERAGNRANWTSGKRKTRGGRQISPAEIPGLSHPTEGISHRRGRKGDGSVTSDVPAPCEPSPAQSELLAVEDVLTDDPFSEERWAEIARASPVLFLWDRSVSGRGRGSKG